MQLHGFVKSYTIGKQILAVVLTLTLYSHIQTYLNYLLSLFHIPNFEVLPFDKHSFVLPYYLCTTLSSISNAQSRWNWGAIASPIFGRTRNSFPLKDLLSM